jgi:hypothetical protein
MSGSLKNMSSWQSAIPSDYTLPMMVMPGSHDAGLSDEHSNTGVQKSNSVVTQNLSIGQQCLAGSRFFDLRFDDGSMRTFHAPKTWLITLLGGLGQGVKSIASEISEFLAKHPTEVLLLRVSKSGKKSVRELQTQLGKHLYKASGNLCKVPLKDLRGKALLVWDKATDSDQLDGVHPYTKYKGGASGSKGIVMCGAYSNSKSLETVIEKQRAHIWEHLNHPEPESHIFVLYWTQTFNIKEGFKKKNLNSDIAGFSFDGEKGVGNNIDKLLELAKTGDKMNLDPKHVKALPGLKRLVEKERLPDMLLPGMAPIKRPNVVFYDFVNVDTSQKIVALNAANGRRRAMAMTQDDLVELARISGIPAEQVADYLTGPWNP